MRATACDEGLGSVLATPVTNLPVKCSAPEPEEGELPGHERSHAGTPQHSGRRASDSCCQCPATVSRTVCPRAPARLHNCVY
eukprot:2455397-Rhodomonas_salina.1